VREIDVRHPAAAELASHGIPAGEGRLQLCDGIRHRSAHRPNG